MRAAIVGCGHAGRAVAAALVITGPVREILLYSRRQQETDGLMRDLQDAATATRARVDVRATVDPSETVDCDVIVLAVRGQFASLPPGQDQRRGGLWANAQILLELSTTWRGYTGTMLVVSNPVDLLARLVAECVPTATVYGIGSNVDSVRYRRLVAEHLGEPVTAVRGHVLGEHGSGAVLCCHATRVHGRPIALPRALLRTRLHEWAPRINAGIGRTQHGPAAAVRSTITKLSGRRDGVEELAVNNGRGVWLGQRVRFTAGRAALDPPELSDEEAAEYAATESTLDAVYRRDLAHLLHRKGA